MPTYLYIEIYIYFFIIVTIRHTLNMHKFKMFNSNYKLHTHIV